MEEAQRAVGEFGGDNRAGIEGTLHRISAIRSRKGMVVGLTCRVGRAVTGHVDMVRDLLNYKESILFLGRYVAFRLQHFYHPFIIPFIKYKVPPKLLSTTCKHY